MVALPGGTRTVFLGEPVLCGCQQGELGTMLQWLCGLSLMHFAMSSCYAPLASHDQSALCESLS